MLKYSYIYIDKISVLIMMDFYDNIFSTLYFFIVFCVCFIIIHNIFIHSFIITKYYNIQSCSTTFYYIAVVPTLPSMFALYIRNMKYEKAIFIPFILFVLL